MKGSKERGLLIALEGVDGTGKSTQSRLLAQRLRRMGIKVYETSEPTGSPIGSLIRQIMSGRIIADDQTIAALFVADRYDHLVNKTNGILKYLKNGFTVITDRYYFSSYAYHGIYMPLEWVIAANAISAEKRRPDINIYLDLAPDKCLKRIETQTRHIELYERIDIMNQVREKYSEAFALLKAQENIAVVDADGTTVEVSKRIWRILKPLYQ